MSSTSKIHSLVIVSTFVPSEIFDFQHCQRECNQRQLFEKCWTAANDRETAEGQVKSNLTAERHYTGGMPYQMKMSKYYQLKSLSNYHQTIVTFQNQYFFLYFIPHMILQVALSRQLEKRNLSGTYINVSGFVMFGVPYSSSSSSIHSPPEICCCFTLYNCTVNSPSVRLCITSFCLLAIDLFTRFIQISMI